MTKMKTLQILDHVCLLVARGFIAFLVIAACLDIWVCGNAMFVGAELDAPLGTIVAKALAQSAFLIVSFLLIQKKIARCCLGVAAALFFIKGAFSTAHRLWELPDVIPSHMAHFLALTFLRHVIPLLGLASLIWISIRPPQNSKTSSSDSFPSDTHPQSY